MENFPFLPHNGDSEGQVERNFMPVPRTIPFYGTVDEALLLVILFNFPTPNSTLDNSLASISNE